LLSVSDLTKTYENRRGTKTFAVRGVSLAIAPGETLGLVGESGCGKTTLGRCILRLIEPTSGAITFDGRDVRALKSEALRRLRREMQLVFQDPYGSLDPRQTVARIVAEPLEALAETTRAEQRQRAGESLAAVGLRSSDLDKYPHEFSGGQRQRIAIARALITRPKLIVADEPVSALDVSVQAQVLNLMQDLQQQFGISYLLISHDLAVVNHLCDEVCVLHRGLVVERGAPQQLFAHAQHPYTQALLAAVPRAEPPVVS
jgi:peptide/nickel transport system ATP-binding protein